VHLVSTAFFVTWDVVALANDYYDRGGSQYMTGAEIGGLLPVEEVFFCAFLPYQTMVLYGLAMRWWQGGSQGRSPATSQGRGWRR
jgi:hypothetical protein